MLSAEMIAQAKREHTYTTSTISHEHDDCIRIAYAWLDAQVKLKNPVSRYVTTKHHIERWAGRYVSQNDVEIAALLHPAIKGTYPNFNLSRRLVLPHLSRLDGIQQANTMPNYRESFRRDEYKIIEDDVKRAA
jgi:nucleoside-diphosphate-sugar epimerase